MWILTIVAILLRLLLHDHLFSFFAKIGQQGQEICQMNIDFNQQNSALLSAMICGTNLPYGILYAAFMETQLYHLVVVSGGHLQALSWLIDKTDTLKKAKLLLFFIYTFLTGFQAPIFRAVIAISLLTLSKKFRWGHGQIHAQFFAGLFCLILFPEWLKSSSLFLSWLASIGLCLGTLFFQNESFKKYLCSNLLIQILFSCIFKNFQWVGLLANLILAPFFAVLLFPVCFLAYISSVFTPLLDFFVAIIIFCTQTLQQLWAGNINLDLLLKPDLWIILFASQISLLSLKQIKYRSQA